MQKETVTPRDENFAWDLNGVIVYIVFIIVGCSSLLPWNAVITATEFFKSKYCDTDLEHLFETYYTIQFTTAQLLGLLSQLYLEIRWGYSHTVTLPLFLSSLLFSLLFLTTLLGEWLQGEVYFYATSPLIFLLGYATIFLTSGVFARSANFESARLSQGAMFGQAFSGVFVSLLSLELASNSNVTDDVLGTDDSKQNCSSNSEEIVHSAQIYFGVCCLSMWISLAAFATSKLNGTVVYKSLSIVPPVEDLGAIDMSKMENISSITSVDKDSESRIIFEPNIKVISYDSADSLALPVEGIENFGPVADIRDCDGDTERILNVMYTLKFFIITIVLTFAGTLSIFPALVSEVWACSSGNSSTFTAILFLVFNIFDAVGRGLSAFAQNLTSCLLYALAILAVSKWAIIPLLAKSNIHGIQIGTPSCNDFYPLTLICILGLTNGFCASCCMMHWSKVLKDPKNENVGATLMIFSITTGLITGSLLSYIVVQLFVLE